MSMLKLDYDLIIEKIQWILIVRGCLPANRVKYPA